MWSPSPDLRRSATLAWAIVVVTLLATGPLLDTSPAYGQPLHTASPRHLTVTAPDAEAPFVAQQPPGTPTAPNRPGIRTGVSQPPPSPGAVVVEDSLTSGGLIPTGNCPSGRVSAETVGEGLILKVRGPCTGQSTSAIAQVQVPGLTIPDGELRFETKVVGAPERASLSVILRSSEVNERRHGYIVSLGRAGVSNVFALGQGNPQLLGMGSSGPASWTDWNTVSLRLQGDGLWLIVNDVPLLSTTDSTYGEGGVVLSLLRSGNVADETETSVVFRNMRISALEGGDPARAPRYQAPPPPAPSSSSTSSDEPPPLPPKPAHCNSIKWERASNGQWILWCDQTDWNQ